MSLSYNDNRLQSRCGVSQEAGCESGSEIIGERYNLGERMKPKLKKTSGAGEGG